MKRFILLIMLCLPIAGMAQDNDFFKLVEKYSLKQDCTTIELTKDALNTKTDITTIWAISVETAELIDEFKSDATKVISASYSPLLTVNSGGEMVKIYSIQKDGEISDLIVFSASSSDGVLVRIVGDNLSLSQAISLMSSMQEMWLR